MHGGAGVAFAGVCGGIASPHARAGYGAIKRTQNRPGCQASAGFQSGIPHWPVPNNFLYFDLQVMHFRQRNILPVFTLLVVPR